MALNLPPMATPPISPMGNDPLQQLRLGGMFPSSAPPNQPIQGGMPVQDNTPLGQIGGMVEGLGMEAPPNPYRGYEPETVATDAFNELLAAYPETKRPGIIQTIIASIASLDNPALVQQILNQPSREQRDWRNRIGPAQAAMNQERYGNSNLRMIASQQSRDELADKRLDQGYIRLGQGDVRLGQGDTRLDQSGQRLDETGRHNRATEQLSDWKAQHPNFQLKVSEDGSIVGINPINPTDIVNTGVQSNQLSDQEKVDARIEAAAVAETGRVNRQVTGQGNTLAAIEARSADAETRSVQDQIDRVALAAEKEKLRRDRPTTPGRSGNSELEKRRAISNKAQRTIAEHPEWSEWIGLDGDKVSITPVKTGGFFSKGPDQSTYDAIFSSIYGSSPKADGITPAVGDKVIVQDKDGKRFRLPAAQLESALTQGYTEVK